MLELQQNMATQALTSSEVHLVVYLNMATICSFLNFCLLIRSLSSKKPQVDKNSTMRNTIRGFSLGILLLQCRD